MAMKYIGDGAFVPPYPARDLSDEEVKEFGSESLLQTGLYVEVGTQKSKRVNDSMSRSAIPEKESEG